MILKGLRLKNGNVTYNDFDIDPDLPFEQQKWSFKQDLLQIVFNDRYLVDVGWYPDFNEQGHFRLVVIQGIDWDNPLMKETCRNYYELKNYLQKAIDFIAGLQ